LLISSLLSNYEDEFENLQVFNCKKIDSFNGLIQNLKEEMQRSVGVIEQPILENIDEICWYVKESPNVKEIDGVKKLCKDESNTFPAVISKIEAVFEKLAKKRNLFLPT
jgi:hypothetical protein